MYMFCLFMNRQKHFKNIYQNLLVKELISECPQYEWMVGSTGLRGREPGVKWRGSGSQGAGTGREGDEDREWRKREKRVLNTKDEQQGNRE